MYTNPRIGSPGIPGLYDLGPPGATPIRPCAPGPLKVARTAADGWGVSTPTVVAGPVAPTRAAVRRQFSEIELAHALRATAAQQLRAAAASRARTDQRAAHIAAIEQAIADRIERLVQERRSAAARTGAYDVLPPRDELAERRTRRVPPTGDRASA